METVDRLDEIFALPNSKINIYEQLSETARNINISM